MYIGLKAQTANSFLMSLISNNHFASASASGKDWREVVKKIIDQLEPAYKDPDNEYTIGFLYVSDLLQEDAPSILNLLRSVTLVNNWVGSVGIGVCSSGREYFDKPAASVMLGNIPEDKFQLFSSGGINDLTERQKLKKWLENNEAMLTLVHGIPGKNKNPAMGLEDIQRKTGGFLVGGLSSSRGEDFHIAGEVINEGFSGVAFSPSVSVATTLSQGCSPMGPVHVITRHEGGNTIIELDNQRAIEVFLRDLRNMSGAKTHSDPAEIIIEEADLENPELAPESIKPLFQGQVHAAFPIAGADQQGDYIVRNILGVDPDFGHLRVAYEVGGGEHVLFVHRDKETIQADLSRTLVSLRKRITEERGEFAPRGAVFISCLARAFSSMGEEPLEEMKLVREIIGELPLCGFYASGEISNSRLYKYTAVLILFF
jgi:small ligand-binding sensory domain FIST